MKYIKNLFGNKKGNAARIYEISKHQYIQFIDHANGILNDIEKSKEIVNEAFAAAYKVEESFQSIEAIVIFLFSTINQSCNAYLKEKEQMGRVKELILSKEKENYQVTKEVLQAVQEEMESLPRQCRLIFTLFFCGLKVEEVAKMVERTEKTVKNQKIIASNALLEALRERKLLIVQKI